MASQQLNQLTPTITMTTDQVMHYVRRPATSSGDMVTSPPSSEESFMSAESTEDQQPIETQEVGMLNHINRNFFFRHTNAKS